MRLHAFNVFKFQFNVHSLLLFMLIFVTACSSNQPSSSRVVSSERPEIMAEGDLFSSLLRNEYLYWKGTPYRLGGNNKKGIDCSALVQAVYKSSFKMGLARTTNKQVNSGFFVDKKALKVGDLVFFKTTRKVRHVGIYLGDNQFLHASTSKGVMISSLDNIYWKSKYWQSRRVLY